VRFSSTRASTNKSRDTEKVGNGKLVTTGEPLPMIEEKI
jgi:hypothetical protein